MELKQKLDGRKDLQHLLFRRGWLVTNASMSSRAGRFPFYDNWQFDNWGGYVVATHREATTHSIVLSNGLEIMLLGHCYNPFTMEHREEEQLRYIAEAYGTPQFQERIDELTGVFALLWRTPDGNLHFMTDPSGMQPVYYSENNGNLYLASHAQIIGDILDLEISGFAKELSLYKWYRRVMGSYLPGDMSKFESVRLAVPDFVYDYNGGKFTHTRIYPVKDVEIATGNNYDKVIKYGAGILKNGAELVCRKWKRPAISLTGGIDSNTTFAAFNGHYGEVEAFSYLSAPKEEPDAEAAKKIAGRFNVSYRQFHIPADNGEIKDFDLKKAILSHNCGDIMPRNDNEIRKRIYLEENSGIGIEVKSWVSETIRAYWFKHYGRSKMPKLSPRVMRSLYKIFLTNRSLAHKVERYMADYMQEFGYWNLPKNVEYADVFYNEITWANWGGNCINEMKYIWDLTFIYNNRKFLAALNTVPLEYRISDRHHLDMKSVLNKELSDMGIRVVNLKETDNRARLLNVIFTVNNWLPF